MKTPLTYGFLLGLGGALLTLTLFFGGFHDSAEKMKSAQWFGAGGGMAISVACLALAMREQRAMHPAQLPWGYGSAVGTGVLTGLFGSLFGAIFGYIYFAYINPQFCDVIFQMQVDKMEASGVTSAQIERAEPIIRKWMSPGVFAVSQAVSGFIMVTVAALIVAIFYRQRPAVSLSDVPPPPLPDVPPPAG